LWKVKTKVDSDTGTGAQRTVRKNLEKNLKKSATTISVEFCLEDCTFWNSTHTQKGTTGWSKNGYPVLFLG